MRLKSLRDFIVLCYGTNITDDSEFFCFFFSGDLGLSTL